MPTPTFSNITTRGGLISADFIENLRQDSLSRDYNVDYKNFPTYTSSAPENQRLLDEQITKTFDSLIERYDAISEFYNTYEISDARQKWMIPLLKALGFDPIYVKGGISFAEDERLVFRLSHQGWDSASAMYIHTVPPKQDLEKRPEEAHRKWSPHEEMQRFLNTTKAHNWGIVTNGILLRIQREFFHTTTKAYVEFDIDNIMRERNFRDFRILYRLAHVSRFLPHLNEKFIIETYYDKSVAAGVRVYEDLQKNVKNAIETLGNGLLNDTLRQQLTENDEACRAYYQEIHRIIYRIMFLLYAEQRAMLPTRGSLFIDEYSITKLREIAERRREPDDHTDLWEGLKVTFRMLQKGCNPLKVFPYNGSLFDDIATPLINTTSIRNDTLLEAIRYLTLVEDERMSKRINYLDIGVEEMGSIYESLLDYKPKIFATQQEVPVLESRRNETRCISAFTFFLDPRGTDRRSTGSYYTASNLVDELITHSLKPVAEQKIEAAKTKETKEAAILSLKVCDPACGSGAFLIAAMNYLGKELAKIRTEQSEPPDDDIRKARREVLQHCIYGVDKNPMAVELAKVSLWIDAAVKDVPLNFLDHHIKCGDSLVGATPELLKAGIPDYAFKRTGDDNADMVKKYKQQNKLEHRQRTVDESDTDVSLKCTEAYERLANLMEQNVADVYKKKELYDKIISSPEWKAHKFAADALCAMFFWKFTAGSPVPITQAPLRILKSDPNSELICNATRDEIARLREQYRFFHWWLEFPDVFGRAEKGFDVILGNPPFIGGLKISSALGDKYLKYLQLNFEGVKGIVDLCAIFFRRGFYHTRNNGFLSMVAINTISQGDTRNAGLAIIAQNNGMITFAHRFIKWPGAATVEVNLIAICKGNSNEKKILDDQLVHFISSRLDCENEQSPAQLKQNKNLCFIGYYVRGKGFVIEQSEAEKLIAQNSKNADCIFTYINGDIINSDPSQNSNRFVIYFRDWPIEKARMYPDLFQIIEERVKPERLKLKPNSSDYRKLREYWWHFSRFAVDMQNATASLDRILVRSLVSDRHMVEFIQKGWIYTHNVIIFAFDDFFHFSLIQSNLHEIWVRKYTSTLRTDTSYAPTDCFETFPFPQTFTNDKRQSVENIGGEYHEHRRQTMLNRQIGLTPTYNLFNDPSCTDADIQTLRDLHARMDNAVLGCYGWKDIQLNHNFYQNERGQTRFTIAPETRIELLNRLLELNLSIAEQEQNGEEEEAKT
jgi:hypothetical protein